MSVGPPIADNGRALDGWIELTAATLPDGRTSLVRQFHTVPFHVGKSYWDGTVLLAQLVNPTAGIFDGDLMRCEVEVHSGARLLLASPSASRAHTMNSKGKGAFLNQHFRVEQGAWLEYFPELFIPQRASRFNQRTEIEVAEGGSLYFVEILAPGRVAHGETMAFAQLDWSFSLKVGDRIVGLERALVKPPEACWMLEVESWGSAYYASVWMVAPELVEFPPGLCERIETLEAENERHVGISRVAPGCYAVKVLARNSISLRQFLGFLRTTMAEFLPGLACSMRSL